MTPFGELLFESATPAGARSRSSRPFRIAVLALLYLAGLLHWGFFMRFGQMAFYQTDSRLFAAIDTRLEEGVYAGALPLHLAEPAMGTDRILGLPHLSFSPLVLLLRFMGAGRFFFFNTLFVYSLGFLGCLLLRRRQRLSLFAFTLFFALFNWNGFITAHYAVGHFWVDGYFLLPFYIALLLDWERRAPDVRNMAGLAFVLAAMTALGSYHEFNWCAMFLAFYATCNRQHWKAAGLVLAGALALAAFRVIPIAISYWGAGFSFLGAFGSVRDLLEGLTAVHKVTDYSSDRVLGWWEYDFYIGVLGLAFIAWFGIWAAIRPPRPVDSPSLRFRAFDLPLMFLSALSTGYFWAVVLAFPIPGAGAERCASRFLILPLVMLMLFAALRFDNQIRNRTLSIRQASALLMGFAVLVFDLLNHSYAWRLAVSGGAADAIEPAYRIVTRSDPVYAFGVKAGFTITFVSMIGAAVLLARARGRKGPDRGNAEAAVSA